MTTNLTDTTGNTPLLSLPNFSAGCVATLLGKQESRNPMGSVKCRIAVAMIDAGLADGSIVAGTTVIEPTSATPVWAWPSSAPRTPPGLDAEA
jgi:cysteine synthase A